MYSADMIVLLSSQSSNTLTAMDLYSSTEDTPPDDESLGGKNDVHLESFNFTNYGFMAIVSRLLDTGDKYDSVIVPNSTIDMICATESKKSWVQHDIESN
ncbi:unnamed protein product [Blepharisma stoltei]|uniref:DOMON domain-containing protein n=1 Tax=Blepharisma stoltei TaxID=1481888 RepID=A0AAU9K043_9CILI|nr:unnamed protein product [Blepharisma stoltei]